MSNTLKHKSFRSLSRRNTDWVIAHLSADGTSIREITARTLEAVLTEYAAELPILDCHSEGASDHNHDWHSSLTGDTMMCRCGAWK